jgi:N-acetyl-gamma-glutamyl-phosphate reductase
VLVFFAHPNLREESMIRVGIIGATGYTGVELLKILQRHSSVELAWLTSESNSGQPYGKVFPVPPPVADLPLISLAQADMHVDAVFACLPHAASQDPVARALDAGAKVVDLSADYRLHSAEAYETWYGVAHSHPQLLTEAVYGLPELHRAEIAGARLVANPGCYPTSVILALAPLARAGWLDGTVIADSKSGVSGAGRQPSLKTHFVEVNENFSPYNIGRSHRHLAEMEQELQALVGEDKALSVVFSPHLTPLNRGILSTIYVTLPAGVSEEQIRQEYAAAYAHEPFVRVLPSGQVATLAHSVGTNYCTLGLTLVQHTRTLIVTASIDNLIKGASGQAVQNLNILFGCDETAGLL